MLPIGQFLIPGLAILLFLAFLLLLKVMASRYQKIPPNKVAIIYGRGTKIAGDGQLQGCKVVSGGGVLVWPVFQDIAYMDTAVFKIPINETNIPNKDNVQISVAGVAACKISTAPEDLQSAAMSFLGQDQTQIESTIGAILVGHVRSIIGKLDIDGVLRDRDAFNKMVVGESTAELKRMGIQVVTLVIQEVNDVHGYIDALGKRAVAEAVRDANIKVAEAEAETRKQVSTCQKEASVVEAQNVVAVAEAEKDRDIKRATFKAASDTEQAKANNAMAIATAAQQQTLKVAEAERDAAQAEAQVKVQQKEAERKEQELIATVVKPAEATAKAAVITADGEKKAAITKAEADKEVKLRQAEGEAQAAEALGKGQAAQQLAMLNANAEGNAAVTRQALLAEAEGNAAMKGKVLEAEAEGTMKMAKALAEMTESARLILILDRLPILLDRGGDAVSKVMNAVFAPVAAGLGNIDSINITDIGGTGRGVNQIGNIVPDIVLNMVAGLAARGVDIKDMLAKAGIDADELVKKLGLNAPVAAPTVKSADTKPVDE